MNKLLKISFIFLIALLGIFLNSCKKTVEYSVMFANTDLENVLIEEGSKVNKPDDPTKEGYVFAGWYTNNDFSEEYDFEKIIEKDTTIYAHYFLTLSKANELAGTDESYTTEDKYYVTGTIDSIQNIEWGNMFITDGTTTLHVYGLYNADGSILYGDLDEKPVVGDTVVLYGVLGYKFEGEMKDAWMVSFERNAINPDINLDEYTDVTISDARDKEVDEKLIVSGVVAAISKASGYSPRGVYLVDETGSIFIYGPDIAVSVSVGNKISVAGIRTNYILDSEISAADKHGYQGSIQLDQSHLVSNDFKDNSFDTSWIEELTLKELMETPVENNITNKIYKVNALITKDIKPGYVNYYINDIDGTTGSYVYTMNNGGDFTWLDDYDGKICSMYLTVTNAKATVAQLIYRLMPIKIISDEYTYDLTYTSEFVVEYYGVEQFLFEYDNDPGLELITSISSELLGFTDAKINYSSSDTNVVFFEEVEGKTIFHTKNPGVAIITVTGNYDDIEYFVDVEITVNISDEYDYIDVLSAINTEDENIVNVRGIVGSSLVNQSGFYLIDETGVIAVKCDASEMADLKLGNEVIVQGNRTHFKAKDGVAVGQSCLLDSTILVNYYGTHDYSTNSFDKTGKTITELNEFDPLVDYSNNVYVITATVQLYETAYYSMYQLLDSDGTTYMRLYSSSASQYSFLADFIDKEVTVELALCNWNEKTYYAGCIISATFEDTKIINNSNFK